MSFPTLRLDRKRVIMIDTHYVTMGNVQYTTWATHEDDAAQLFSSVGSGHGVPKNGRHFCCDQYL